MRYCIGCTFIENDGRVSSPYILVSDGRFQKFVPYLIKDCNDKLLLIATDLKMAEKGLKAVKNMQLSGNLKCNYFLLKVDSLNFPFVLNTYVRTSHTVGMNTKFYGYQIMGVK